MSKNIYKGDKISVKILKIFATFIKYLILYSLIIILFLAISWILIKSYRYITTTSIFSLKYIEINGLRYLRKNEILQKINVNYGQNIFDINLFDIKKKLLKDKWVKDVLIKRIIPNKIVINLTERDPIFILHEKKTLYYISKDGTKIDRYGDKILDLPVLELEDEKFLSKIDDYWTFANTTISMDAIGWVYIGKLYIKLYDYKNKVLWYIDTDKLNSSIKTAHLIWNDIKRRGEATNVARIIVINRLAWVKIRN